MASEIVKQNYLPLAAGVQVGAMPHSTAQSSLTYAHALIYGYHGVGKSFMLKTWPKEAGNVYMMDCGCESDGINEEHIYYEKVQSYMDVLNRIAYLQKSLEAKPDIFKLVWVDNLTEMQRWLLQTACGAEVPEKRHWGIVLSQMEVIIRNILSLPCHSVFIAHENEWQGSYSPYLDGRLKTEILGKFSIIGRMIHKQVEKPRTDLSKPIEMTDVRAIQFEKTNLAFARVRGGKLPAMMLPNIYEIVKTYQS